MRAGRPGVRLEVLGHWQLTAAGRSVALGQREQRLLGLLAVRRNGSRSLIAGTLWPDSSESLALANLRSALWQVQHRVPAMIEAQRSELTLAGFVQSDVGDLLTMVNLCESEPDKATTDDIAILATRRLLPGWTDEWVLLERERICNRQLAVLQAVARDRATAGCHRPAILAAEAATRLEPLSEDTVELLITSRLAVGDRSGALQAYRQWEHRLRRDLRLEPTLQMRRLVPRLIGDATVDQRDTGG
ncbi:hypothetical protein FOE78_12230 [Microlunatus elymi]|uniref:Bacterial transcriptional activator domain-containing protein n=1 Tax=Microlunatus elymi TaxID=2596828 RepID=A0A516PZK0_9ACTN|nr:BTAD domain-containing putative transcriptional regulator [Microlunatus elymi]QDP96572.1 hypothetical protein FOE78_12230 [Microlunatus elymi]